jgi:predicted transglutaminase-like cysteine proteinase
VALAVPALPVRAWDAAAMQVAARGLGPAASSATAPLQGLLRHAAWLDEPQRLALINDYVNQQIAFGPDLEVWGQPDYWASPLEVLARGRGDCEDYAIAKYAALVAAGTPSAHLRLAYVLTAQAVPGSAAPAGGAAHMVLVYQVGGDDEPLILDNLRSEVLPASSRADLQPVYSFDTEGLWQGIGPIRKGDAQERLWRWREVLGKIRTEGFY